MKSMKLLRELKTLLLENKILVSKLAEEINFEDQRSMVDKKYIQHSTEWEISQDLKKLDEITRRGEIDDDSKLNNGEENEY